MRSVITLLGVVLLLCIPSFGQIDMNRYMGERHLPLLDLTDYLQPKFKWNMEGKMQVFLNEGITNLAEDHPKIAIVNFTEVIKLDHTFWVSYYYRGIAYKMLGKLTEALRDLRAAKALNPKQPEIYVELGEVLAVQSQFYDASVEYDKAIEIAPKFVQATYNLGCLAVIRSNLRTAYSHFEKCTTIDPQFPQAFMMLGLLRYEANHSDPQIYALYDKAIAADSTYSATYFWRGAAYTTNNQPLQCLKDWNRVVRFNPSNSFYTLMRGFLYIELERYDEAFVDLRKALKSREISEDKFNGQQTLFDKQVDLQYAVNYLIANGYGLRETAFEYLKIGFCQLLAQNYQGAINSFGRSFNVQKSGLADYLTALTFEHAGQHKQAFLHYESSLRLDKDNFDAHKKHCIYLAEGKLWEEAYADLAEMLRIQPGAPVAYRLRGVFKSTQGDCVGAIPDLNEFMKTDSTDQDILRIRATCKQKTGDLQGAADDFFRILSFDPQHWELYEEVAGKYLALHDTVGAVAVYRKFSVNDPRPHLSMAKLFYLENKMTESRQEIDAIHSLSPISGDANFHSDVFCLEGKLDREAGNHPMAITKFSKALDKNRTNLEAKYLRAKSYQMTGQNKKAKGDYQQLAAFHYLDSDVLYNSIPDGSK